jgi:glycerol-3-phosphate acyltransferase PlsY
MWLPILLVLFAYLMGSLSGSLSLGRVRGVDIRTLGSGNAGGTNALRTQGWAFAIGTALIDVGKGALAAWLALRIAPPQQPWLPYAAALAAVAGHVWPLWHGFRGGKGMATLVGALLVLWPVAALALVLAWLLVLSIGGYVGLSTVVAAWTLPLLALAAHENAVRVVFALGAALFIVYTHRANLVRLRAGTESRFERARLWRRLFTRRQA